MSGVKPISLDISKAQFSRLANGHKITVKHEHVGKGLKVELPSGTVEQLKNAKKHQKNIKIQLTKIEGGGIKDRLKKAWKIAKPVAGPLIRKGLKAAIMAAPAAMGQPQLMPVAAALAGPVVDEIGKKVGFGIKKRKVVRRTVKPVKMGEPIDVSGGSLRRNKKFVEATNQGPLIPVGSVAFYPKHMPEIFDTSKPDKSVVGRGTRANIRHHVPHHKEGHVKITRGGSFKPA